MSEYETGFEENEKQREFARMRARRVLPRNSRGGSVVVSASISPHFWKLSVDNHISWSEAMRVGISMILAERGVTQYDNKLNILRKMNNFRVIAEEASQKVQELTEKLAAREGISFEKKKDDEEVIDEVLNEEPIKE